MKRNEMLELIYETIYQHNRKPGFTMYEMAELILSTQERVGMQPPKIQQYVLPNGQSEFAYMEWINKWED